MEFYLRVNYTCGESGEQRACYYFVSTPNDRSFYSKVKLSLGDPLDQQSSSNVIVANNRSNPIHRTPRRQQPLQPPPPIHLPMHSPQHALRSRDSM
ncbi:unnamed protein product, partial [Mesorhabditis belari]|uniref:Uncharacterized protein n=1 Tax=Mesorhabditis belari TaxID=2138241 RepID=A0AAF3F8X1_9BILA